MSNENIVTINNTEILAALKKLREGQIVIITNQNFIRKFVEEVQTKIAEEEKSEDSTHIKREDIIRMSTMCDKFDALLKEIEENPFTAAKHLKAHKE